MTKNEIEKDILELCAEDYYGVWELYWPYSNATDKTPKDVDLFINAIKELVDTKKIAPFQTTNETNEFWPIVLDLDRLKSEILQVKAGNVQWEYYWFGLVK
jgi:predicted nucleotidyltransferase